MALLQKTLRMLVLTAMAAAGTLSWADQPYHPFAEPMSYDPDWQFFAPVDIQEMEDLSARQRANYGWYLTYDRLHIGLDRPLIEVDNDHFDKGWGNLWTFGVMNDEDSGWDFQFLHITGPNTYESAVTSRRVVLPPPDGDDPQFSFFPDQLQERFDYDPTFGNGTFRIHDSINVAKLGSFEINKKWRRNAYQYGGFIEPLLGIRYMDFTDTNSILGYDAYTLADGSLAEEYTISDIINQNRMVLGQVGFRYFRDFSRFQLSWDFKAMGGGNFQTGTVDSRTYGFAFAAADPEPTAYLIPAFRLTNAPGLENKLVGGMDTRVQLSYNLTRAVNFRFGLSMLYIGNGIARGSQVRGNPTNGGGTPNAFGPSAQFVQQNIVMPGISFGFTVNR